ncbi:MAG: hypothetical protein H7326_05080, partial [Bdellovibrionaceae bacterium]|nr:hypothetical protein [Pseudobdellovibrionaceae bacterium]
MKYAILIILGIVLSLVATAGVSAGVKPLMDQMLNQIFILKPFLVSEEKFADQKNSKAIQRALQNMADISVKIAHEDSITKSGFQMPAKVLTAQLRESELIFSAGNKNYSLWMVKSTLGVCISCHTQLPAVSTRFTTLNNLKVLRNPFEEAEFLFTIRNFDEAMPLYQNALKGYPQNAVTVDSLEKIVYRQLYYYVRVARDFKALVKTLDANLINSNLSASQRQKIQSLKVAAGEFDGAQYPRFKTTEGAQLRSFVETNLKA